MNDLILGEDKNIEVAKKHSKVNVYRTFYETSDFGQQFPSQQMETSCECCKSNNVLCKCCFSHQANSIQGQQ